MRSVNLFRLLKGYVEFESKTGNYNKFLSDALENGIHIWDVKIKDGYIISGKVYDKQFRWINENSAKYNMEIEVIKERGVILKASKIANIYSIVLGFFLAVLIITVLSQFIWEIKIIGDEVVDKKEVLRLIDESGIKIGTTGKGIDLRNIEQVIMSKTDNLAWIGISRYGTTVYVDVRERVVPEKLTYNDEPCNIVAFCDGFIKSASVYKGKLEVAEESGVKKGDLLVSGSYKPGEDAKNMIYTHASAEIIAECPITKTFYLPLNSTEKERTNQIVNRKYLKIFNLKIPLFIARNLGEEYICESSEENIKIFNLSLPVAVTVDKYTKLKEVKVDYSETKDEVMDEMIKNYEEIIKDKSEIISKTEDRKEKDGMYIATVKYMLEMDIAQEEIIFVK